MELLKEPAQARRGIDYATATYFAATSRRQQIQFGELMDIADEIAPNWAFREIGSSAHFERVFMNDMGIRLEMTELSSSVGRNRGTSIISLPGTCWWIQSDKEAAFNLLRLAKIDGFKKFSRLDFQNTELEPEVDAYAVRHGVMAGDLWVNGASTFRDYMERDADGQPLNGLTLYWGSKRSEKTGRSYDKAADGSWSTPAIRDEVQTRGRWAATHGQALIDDLASCHGSPEMVEKVHQHTCSALNQHLQYWALNGTTPKTDKNWKRKAAPADWYTKRIGKRCAPLQKGSEPALDLEKTVDYGVQQYGRHFARWVHEQSQRTGLEEDFVLQGLYLRFQSRLKLEDQSWFLEGLDEKDAQAKLAQLEELKNEIAVSQEEGWWPEI